MAAMLLGASLIANAPAVKYEAPKPAALKNEAAIERLIECESHGVNISKPDSDGLISDGILQFHRGPSNKIGSGTWSDMSALSGIVGSPIIPDDAKRMADWMLSNGRGPRWSCWQLIGMSYLKDGRVWIPARR